MNYSKSGLAEKQRKIQSASVKLSRKFNIIVYRIFLITVVTFGILGAVSAYGVLNSLIDTAPDINSISVAPSLYKTYVYDNNNTLIKELLGAEANRDHVSIDKIPEVVKQAFIAVEDERFYEHNGIDVRGIFRAFFVGVTNGTFNEGASTLTQQLLKNKVFGGGNESNFIVSMQRKVQEQYLAIQLEDKMPKEQILEHYLNSINLGSGTLGVQAASQRYFNKNVQDLNLAEASVIAGITQSPTMLSPVTYPENNKVRRQEVLDSMLKLGYITKEEYDETINDNIYDVIKDVNKEISGAYAYNTYFVDEVIEQVIDDLVEKKGYTATAATNLLYTGGLRIYTTQDRKLQQVCNDVLSNEELYPKGSEWELEYRLSILNPDGTQTHYSEGHIKKYFLEKDKEAGVKEKDQFDLYFKNKDDANEYIEAFKKTLLVNGASVVAENINFKLQPQVSFTLMDQHTGEVKAIVGGRGDKTGNRTLNRATNTLRQPGSTFKVLSTYLPALDVGGMTLGNVMDDSEYYYPGTETKVNNWNGESYQGLSTLRQAIKKSMNIVTVKTLAEITPAVGFSYLERLGFTSLVTQRTDTDGKTRSDINLPLALGGITDGVSNLELTAAYAAIANGGYYQEPIFYTKITDRQGNVIIDNESSSTQVMKESTAWLLTDAMKDVVAKGGTGAMIKFSDMPLAGKTGTTSKDYDLWFSGYTPYYTATIWSGYDYSKNQDDTSFHKYLWKEIMSKIHKEMEVVDFPKPDSIVSAKICSKSGKLAIPGICDKALGGSTVIEEYFAKGTQPTELCDSHVEITICEDTGLRANNSCPDTKTRVYLKKDNETSKTADTKNIMPKHFEDNGGYCTLHTPTGSLGNVEEANEEGSNRYNNNTQAILPEKPQDAFDEAIPEQYTE